MKGRAGGAVHTPHVEEALHSGAPASAQHPPEGATQKRNAGLRLKSIQAL